MYECPSCGESFEERILFCERCGSRMYEAERERRCPSCGAENEAEASSCASCGESLTESSEEVESHSFHCRACGAEIEEDSRFCSLCGTRVGEALSRRMGIGLLVGGVLLAVLLPIVWFLSAHRSYTRRAVAVQAYQPQVVDDPHSSVAAKINGEEISKEEFSRVLDQAKAPYEQQYGSQVFQGVRGKAMLGQLAASTMDRLINRRLLVREALRAGTPEVSQKDVAMEIEKVKREKDLSDRELEERLALDGRTLSDFKEDLREQLFIQRFVESEIVGGARDEEAQPYLFSRWFSNLKTTANITIFLADTRPVAASAGCGAGGGGCGGSSSCSGSCGSGVTQPLDPRIEAEAKAKGLEYYQAKHGPGEVVAKVSNYGCHIQVDIIEGDEIVQSLTYSGGQVFEI